MPFGTRKLTGVILRCHDDPPEVATRDALRLIDSEPVLSAELLALGRWISGYYCSPLGDVLRGMLPLASEIRRGKIWTLTDSGRDAARQLLLDTSPDDPVLQILRMLEKRPLSAAYLAKAMPLADKAIRALERKGFIVAEEVQTERDPLRAPSERLRVELLPGGKGPEPKLNKPERELRAFLELHPGSHNLKELEDAVKNASPAARSLARKGLVTLKPETVAMKAGHPRAPRAEPRAAGRLRADPRRHTGQALPHLSAARRHRLGQDRGLSQRHRSRAGGRAQRAAAGARDRAHARRWRASSSRASATAWPFCTAPSRDVGAHRSVAAHPLGRGQRGGGHALRRVRAGAESRADRGG